MNHSGQHHDLKGLNQLTKDGIIGIVDVVEAMHQRMLTFGGLLNRNEIDKTNGLTGFIYQTIRLTTALSIKGIDFTLSKFNAYIPTATINQKQRNNWVSILNGIMGDYLCDTNNPLALDMSWQHQGQGIAPEVAAHICGHETGQPLLLIHGLCMNDELWHRKGHDHGAALKRSMQMTPIYLRYNTGLAVYQNGQKLAQMLADFCAHLPPGRTFDVLCHSMGGLVMRSALHIAENNQAKWLKQVNNVVFLGTPHQGAVLEKTGNLIDYLISINPYSAPFSKIVKVRSHGIKNLRHGTVTADHQTIQLPAGINAYALAASTQNNAHHKHHKWIGDGLVSVDSALGVHQHPERGVLFNDSRRMVIENVSHMDLLSDPTVFKRLQQIYALG